ncbi:MAG: diguanylate cyclase [Gammaproteobacteria bacterium]|nr:diguanylate cyclase [Gammaproteobacteria bacterium]
MPDNIVLDFNQQLAGLKNDYISNLKDEFKQIEKLIHLLSVEKNKNAKILDDLQHRFHKMAGSGGTFGFDQLTKQARRFENDIIQSKESLPHASEPNIVTYLKDNIHLLINSLEEVHATVSASASEQNKTEIKLKNEKHIYLIEDDLHLAEHLKIQLESFGYHLHLFNSIDSADKHVDKQKPDMLIFDIILDSDKKNSTKILLQNRPNLLNDNCPLLFITQNDSFDNRIRAAKLGALGFYLKPLNIPMLVNRITDIFEQKTATPGKVLIVDDDKQLALNYQLVLQGVGIEVEILKNSREIYNEVMEFKPDLLLMDLHMPDYSGPELAGILRQYDNLSSLSIVYLSSEQNLEIQQHAINKGADDFLSKPIHNTQLISAVKYRINRSRIIKEKISRDSLTGLMKHANIKEAAKMELMRSKRNKKPVTLVMLDIDHFKQVNDTYGHATGDVVINSLAILLRQRLRQTDIIGRYGGEEFLVILPDCNNKFAINIIDDIRRNFNEVNFNYQGKKFNCSLSAGTATSTTFSDLQSDELLIKSDQAMYKAKESGRNRVVAAQE